ncbi:ComEA family DNA-binding protein [Mycetocola manganoxydans]|uniref:ComEA family DNA-binding protein n=1 Tax=Mycetocola manganoxydans TaxID=699879 RepID=A0A3L6ZUZ6_9MICO|nr:ComEA family DNA-binding protein [Mycetocola manganoxydans]RLP71717.1 ComEA family DNA-binding protein [Mycetocola manganoxydans]GHD39218.1 hypothetical protein GCM10008097_01670 [Mycetocola manganoxydans]
MARHASARPPRAASAPPGQLATRRSTGARIGAGAFVVLLLGGLITAVIVSLLGATGQARTLPLPSPTAAVDDGGGAAFYVHVLGEVTAPGVYSLRDGDRVVDAIAAAGGFTAEADQQAVNLARFLSDGEQILVLAVGAAPPPGQLPGAPGGPGVPGLQGDTVNLNTATTVELETLPRVGPALAQRILAWRDANGRFGAVEDLLNVPGIGDKTFETLRDLVSV